jgi:F-type H+-transporting ATPase subunit a
MFQIFFGLFVVGLVLFFLGVKMTRDDLHISAAAEPLTCIGGERIGDFCSPGTVLPITNGLIMTVLIDLALVLTIIFGAVNMKLIPSGFQNIVEVVIEGFYNFALGVDRKNVAKFFPLPATIFLFFLYANFLALVPGIGSIGNCVTKVEQAAEGAHTTAAVQGPSPVFSGLPGFCEAGHTIIPWLRAPSADLNVTFAFALAAVFMVELFGFQALGANYLLKFFNFREGFIGAFVGFIELISEVVRILAFAFRIFGNIFGGEVILVVMAYLFPYLLPLPFYGFEVFVAFIQAVIFGVLTLVFMSIAVQSHGGHDEQGHPESPMPAEAVDLPNH